MKKGFTLVELIVVIAIIAILAAVVAPQAFRAIEKGKVSALLGDYKSIKTATMALYADTNSWPADGNNGEDLVYNASGISGWDGPYLEKWPGQNPFGGTYTINNESATRDWDGDGSNDDAVVLQATNISNTQFNRIDNQIDGGDGAANGSMRYNAANSRVDMLLSLK
ncbi:MAG: type II/IV secretion system protein [Candidatus Omnitrophota bacterium]|nr:MAG: type II/IV secretion system protein [Candidatus Omnitrophota bacterium]HDN85841.1 prepilin-type N-terminal cleavage/methylation domain-containing protein [Candidatus Omnitrophota bacterium]